MRLTLVAAGFGLVSAVTLVAGCSAADGTPSPASPPSSSPAGGDTTAQGAPKVKTPIDTTRFQAAPCTMLTTAQTQPFTITKPGDANAGTSALGPGCSWSNAATGTGFTVEFITANPKGLSALYANKDIITKGGGYFEAATVQGYPAIFESSVDQRKEGTCGLDVAVSDALD
ncbi:MAG: DUF3558 family protein, partial [Kutzneria sp.]|nr:DUF3558 family protein [Kutzneria sp.]